MVTDCTDEILTDLLTRIPSVVLMPHEDFEIYWEQVGAWLLRLSLARLGHWTNKFTHAIHQSHGIHPDYAVASVQRAVEQAKQKEVTP